MLDWLKKLNWGHLIIAALLTVIGLCFLFFSSSLVAVTVISGIIISLFGAFLGFVGFKNPKRDLKFIILISAASLCFVSGVVTAILNDKAMEFLIAAICLVTVVDGSFKLNLSIRAKKYNLDAWWIITAISVLVILSAFFLAKFTPQNYKAASVWLGITMLINSASNFIAPSFIAKCQMAQKAEIYYEAHDNDE
ncbi:MAG: hypothetical protein E7612_06935 [Ruminococcaceae bacterium]|nr:hypothetical protein [Oscillospiraceae bacterium]